MKSTTIGDIFVTNTTIDDIRENNNNNATTKAIEDDDDSIVRGEEESDDFFSSQSFVIICAAVGAALLLLATIGCCCVVVKKKKKKKKKNSKAHPTTMFDGGLSAESPNSSIELGAINNTFINSTDSALLGVESDHYQKIELSDQFNNNFAAASSSDNYQSLDQLHRSTRLNRNNEDNNNGSRDKNATLSSLSASDIYTVGDLNPMLEDADDDENNRGTLQSFNSSAGNKTSDVYTEISWK